MNISHLIMGAIILSLLWFLLLKPSHKNYQDNTQTKTIDSLNHVIKNTQLKNIQLDKTIYSYKRSIDSLNIRIDNTNKEIKQIREYYGKKIQDITFYTPTQLDEFFSKRYK